MVDSRDYNYLKELSIKELKEKVANIKKCLPLEEQKKITYSKNFTISLSNYCQNFCGYCFYNYKVPKLNGEENIVLIENEQLVSLIQKAIKYNCKEALIMSGERPESFKIVNEELKKRNCDDFIQFIIDICTNLLPLHLLPHTNIGVLSYNELKLLKNYNASMGLMLESSSKKLFKKGGVHEFSPGKESKLRIEHIKNAGKLKIPFTTGLLLGIGENVKERINDLYLIKQLHEKYGHIQEVIIQNFIYKEGIMYKPENPISMEEILKTVGMAKIILENNIAVQVAPNLIAGYEKEFIDMGINDFGGISPITKDYINPESPWPQLDKLEKICYEKGYILKERLPIYDNYIKKKEFISENIKKVLKFYI
jgi:FO synthase subunit 1